MGLYVFLAILSVYIFISLLLLPLQYRFLKALKEEEAKNRAKGKSQGELYDNMNAGELALQENIQGNPLFFLANILASIMYKWKHPKQKKFC
ncbi:DUF3949 domain-containing protein [Neobacillus terrae]|uniref:DUF3949 domain-containing protein n=1 Tax=Neobacillus terrae TaxID=3034837 RepID=UPI0014082F02|nr:DUF3949 domain-containing protein [Neobacillus terrae]NHM32715.1 DUF3949 domain-containing protein [Neobacillus terrae]